MILCSVAWIVELAFTYNSTFGIEGLDAMIPCSNKTNRKGELTDNPVWLDDRDREVSANRLRPSPSTHSLQATDVQLEDTGRYTCRFQVPGENRNATFSHHLIVYHMPMMTMEISLSYIVPSCRQDRLKERMDNFLPRFATWPAKRGEYRISRYSCVPLRKQKAKTPEMLFNFVITRSLGDAAAESLTVCNVECMKMNALNLLMNNLTLDLTERWKKMERLNSTNRLFPEFHFDASLFNYKIVSDCDFGYELFQQIICLPCRPGTYHDKQDRKCYPCPMNFFQTSFSVLHCNPCALNGTTDSTGTIYPANCTALNPVLRTVPVPYILFICAVLIILLTAVFVICIQQRKHIAQCCRNVANRAVLTKDVKVAKDKSSPRVPTEDVTKEERGKRKPTAQDDAFFDRQFKRGLVRMTSRESLTSFVMKRRMAKTAVHLGPKKISKRKKIPKRPGLMNMYFERYAPLSASPTDDVLQREAEPAAAAADVGVEPCPDGVCPIGVRPIRYPLPWAGFDPQSEPPSPFPAESAERLVGDIGPSPPGQVTAAPPGGQMTTKPPSVGVHSLETTGAQTKLPATTQPTISPTHPLTSTLTNPQHLSAFKATRSTLLTQQKQQSDETKPSQSAPLVGGGPTIQLI